MKMPYIQVWHLNQGKRTNLGLRSRGNDQWKFFEKQSNMIRGRDLPGIDCGITEQRKTRGYQLFMHGYELS